VLDYQTDARVLHYETRDDRLHAIDMVDATHARALHDGWLSVVSTESIADLHVSIDGTETLTLWSSAPPPELRIEGAGVGGVRAITLNGRGLYLGPSGGRDLRVVHGSDWREITPRAVSRDHESVLTDSALHT
jgi:hypothetical protein